MRRSSTLPCFRDLAGLKGPSKSSVLLLVADFTVKTQRSNLSSSFLIKKRISINCKKALLPAATMGEASFPFDMEGPNIATGALKVNPAYKQKRTIINHSFLPNQLVIIKRPILLTEGEKEGGLAAVALTIGEENVKGTHGGVEAVGGSWKKHEN